MYIFLLSTAFKHWAAGCRASVTKRVRKCCCTRSTLRVPRFRGFRKKVNQSVLEERKTGSTVKLWRPCCPAHSALCCPASLVALIRRPSANGGKQKEKQEKKKESQQNSIPRFTPCRVGACAARHPHCTYTPAQSRGRKIGTVPTKRGPSRTSVTAKKV